MTVDFRDEGPGPQKKFKYEWDDIIPTLKSRPGKWAVISGRDTSDKIPAAMATARRIKDGWVNGTNKGEFDATVRGTTVYARYIGANGEYATDDE